MAQIIALPENTGRLRYLTQRQTLSNGVDVEVIWEVCIIAIHEDMAWCKACRVWLPHHQRWIVDIEQLMTIPLRHLRQYAWETK